MALTDLVTTLRSDLADQDSERFSDEVLARCILRSAFPVGRDTGVPVTVSRGALAPEPEGEILEVLLLQARIAACQFMRASTASAVSITSGDKRVDKTSQPEHWAKLEADLTLEYRERVRAFNPGASFDDAYIFTPKQLTPLVFEQGVDLEDTL